MIDNGFSIGLVTFACLLGGISLGLFARGVLPEPHRSKPTEDVIRLAMGVIATMSALVIGLLIASAKTSLDAKDGEVKQLAGDIVLLDRQLAQYGPKADAARDLLRQFTVYKVDSTCPGERAHPPVSPDGWRLLESMQGELHALAPTNDTERWLQNRALDVSGQVAQTRWLLQVQTGITIPVAFLAILIAWLTIIMASFGLYAPRNATAVTALVLCALSISGATFLIIEMARPFSGLIHISSAPMREALALLGK